MKSRIPFIDFLKTVAILGVIIIHVSSRALMHYEVASVNWNLSVFWGAVVRWSVPVFLMCSGVLFLNSEKKVSIKQLFSKYIPRLITALVFWAVLYEACDVYLNYVHTGFIELSALKESIKNLLSCNTHFHLYYLYIIILIYALIPIIRVFTNVADRQHIEYALGVWLVFGIVYPFIVKFYPFSILKGIVVQYKIAMAYSSVGYFILGHYLHKYTFTKKTNYIIYLLGAAGFAITLAGTIYRSKSSNQLNTIFLEGMSPNILLMACGIFLLARNI